MRYYLLDKVTARLIVQGLVKLEEEEFLTQEKQFVLDIFKQATSPTLRLFIVPATANILQRLAQLPQYSAPIHRFLNHVEVVLPGLSGAGHVVCVVMPLHAKMRPFWLWAPLAQTKQTAFWAWISSPPLISP